MIIDDFLAWIWHARYDGRIALLIGHQA
jgi:hypothetical protein